MRAKQSANAIRPSQKGGHGQRQAQDKGEEGRGGRDIFYYRVGHDLHRRAAAIAAQGCPASSTLNHPAAAPTSPGKHLRLQAERQVKEAGKLLKWALTEQTNAENKYAIKIRVHQAKCKRLEAKKITGSAVERMSGAYDLLNPEGRVGCGQEIPFGDRSCA